MIVLQREHVWALQILERNQKWVSGYVGDMRTFFPGSAHLGYREGKQTKDSLHGKMPYIKLQKKAGPHRDSGTHHSASSTGMESVLAVTSSCPAC
jgi:hypothetical protein